MAGAGPASGVGVEGRVGAGTARVTEPTRLCALAGGACAATPNVALQGRPSRAARGVGQRAPVRRPRGCLLAQLVTSPRRWRCRAEGPGAPRLWRWACLRLLAQFDRLPRPAPDAEARAHLASRWSASAAAPGRAGHGVLLARRCGAPLRRAAAGAARRRLRPAARGLSLAGAAGGVRAVARAAQAQVGGRPALLFARTACWPGCSWRLRARRRGCWRSSCAGRWTRRRDTPREGQLLLHGRAHAGHAGHLQRLLAEHLAQLRLPAPVLGLRLRSHETAPLPGESESLLADERRAGDSLQQTIERLTARLGPTRFCRPSCAPTTGPSMQAWRPADAGRLRPAPARSGRAAARPPPARRRPGPTSTPPGCWPSRSGWRAPGPTALPGAADPLSGPQRLEAGWWGWMAARRCRCRSVRGRPDRAARLLPGPQRAGRPAVDLPRKRLLAGAGDEAAALRAATGSCTACMAERPCRRRPGVSHGLGAAWIARGPQCGHARRTAPPPALAARPAAHGRAVRTDRRPACWGWPITRSATPPRRVVSPAPRTGLYANFGRRYAEALRAFGIVGAAHHRGARRPIWRCCATAAPAWTSPSCRVAPATSCAPSTRCRRQPAGVAGQPVPWSRSGCSTGCLRPPRRGWPGARPRPVHPAQRPQGHARTSASRAARGAAVRQTGRRQRPQSGRLPHQPAGPPAIVALLGGELDAVVLVSAPEGRWCEMLLRTPGIGLLDRRGEAWRAASRS